MSGGKVGDGDEEEATYQITPLGLMEVRLRDAEAAVKSLSKSVGDLLERMDQFEAWRARAVVARLVKGGEEPRGVLEWELCPRCGRGHFCEKPTEPVAP